MKDRSKLLEEFSKQLSQGLPFAEDFIEKGSNVEDNALLARNLSEDALGHQVLKNTGIPIPGKEASSSKVEDFLNRIHSERYPELTSNVKLGDGYAQYGGGQIDIGKNMAKNSPIESVVGKTLHEAGHQYDDQILGKLGKDLNLRNLRNAKNAGFDLKGMDPAQVYEYYSKGHHQTIPNLREGSFGLGALKSMLKNGAFKALPLVGPALGAAMSLDSDNAAAAVPILNEAEPVGESPEQENQMLAEIQAKKNYVSSPAAQARKIAIANLKKNY